MWLFQQLIANEPILPHCRNKTSHDPDFGKELAMKASLIDTETDNTVIGERKETAIFESWKPQLVSLLKENEKLLFWKEKGKVQYLVLDIPSEKESLSG